MILGAGLAIGIVALVVVLAGVRHPILDSSDFASDYASARAWTAGQNPYADSPTLIHRYIKDPIATWPHPFTSLHPPLSLLLDWPFSKLPYRTALFMWVVLMAALIMFALRAVLLEIGVPSVLALGIATAVLALPAVQLTVRDGEPNAVVLLLLVAAWLALNREKPIPAGIFLGIAAALKLFPILLVVPLIRHRKFDVIRWQLGTAAVASAIGAAVLGPKATVSWLKGSSSNISYWRGAGHNISLVAVPFRWLTRNPWFPHTGHAPIIAAVLSVVLFAGLIYLMWITPHRASGSPLWATMPLAIMASTIAWADYGILILPLVVLMVHRLRDGRRVLVLLAAALALIGRPFFVYLVVRLSVAQQVLVLSLPLVGLAALAALEWMPYRRAR